MHVYTMLNRHFQIQKSSRVSGMGGHGPHPDTPFTIPETKRKSP